MLARISIVGSEVAASVQNCRKSQLTHKFECKKTLQECISICDDSMIRLRSHKRFYFIMALTMFVILVYTLDIYPPYGWKTMYLVLKVLLSGMILFFVFMATLWNSIEYNGIYSGKLAMAMTLENMDLENSLPPTTKECL